VRVEDVVNHLSEPTKHILDIGAIGVAVATLLTALPIVASILSVVWLGMRVYLGYREIRYGVKTRD